MIPTLTFTSDLVLILNSFLNISEAFCIAVFKIFTINLNALTKIAITFLKIALIISTILDTILSFNIAY